MIVNHFIGNNEFEACIEEKKRKYRVGWRSSKKNHFMFIRVPFKDKKRWASIHYTTGKKVRLSQWTTLSTALKEFNKMVQNHNQINFK